MQTPALPKEVLVVSVGLVLIGITLVLTLWRDDAQTSELPADSFAENSTTTRFFETVNYIRSEELQEDLFDTKRVIFDLRGYQPYELSHIPNSLLANPASVVDLFKNRTPSPQKVLLVDEAGQTENLKVAIENLRDAGIQNIQVLAGGYASWDTVAFQTVSWGDPALITDYAKVRPLSVENAKTLLSDPRVVFLDVRKKSSYDADHRESSLNIPLDDIEQNIQKVPTGQMIIVYGENVLESYQAGVRLFDLGNLLTYTLDGGYEDLK